MKLSFSILILLMSVWQIDAQEQKCCVVGTVAPKVTPVVTPYLPINSSTAAPTLSVQNSADLPNVEYLITKEGKSAGNSVGGDIILGVDADGVFIPANQSYAGISFGVGDTVEITPMGFDLNQQRTFIDALLNNTRTQGFFAGQPCCTLFPSIAAAFAATDPSFTSADSIAIANFCDSVRSKGINGSADITGLADLVTVWEEFGTEYESIESLVDLLTTLNGNGGIFGSDCGGTGANDFISYGVWLNSAITTPLDMATSVVERLNEKTNFLIYPNPTHDKVNILLSIEQDMNMQVRVLNTMGQVVKSRLVNLTLGNQTINLDLNDLAPSVYYLQLDDGSQQVTKKVIVK